MTVLRAHVEGIGILGPGLPDWPTARRVLAGGAPFVAGPVVLPPVVTLPPAERRRVGRVVKLALAVGYEAMAAAGRNPADVATVFSSSGADVDNCHEISQQLATSDRQISPTRFHNSVHNVPAGYWGIATGAMADSTALCAFDGSFGAGLLEAVAHVAVERVPVLLVAYDASYPEPLRSARPLAEAFAIGLLLAPEVGPRALAGIELSLVGEPAESLDDPALEAQRTGAPAARGLPLLRAIARGGSGRAVLDYLPGRQLAVTVTP
jgi:hypothetical protein